MPVTPAVPAPAAGSTARSGRRVDPWRASLICSSVIRQVQLPLGVPGTFIRASEPSVSTSCIGTIAKSATDPQAVRIRCQTGSSSTCGSYLRRNCRSFSVIACHQPSVVSLSCVPV